MKLLKTYTSIWNWSSDFKEQELVTLKNQCNKADKEIDVLKKRKISTEIFDTAHQNVVVTTKDSTTSVKKTNPDAIQLDRCDDIPAVPTFKVDCRYSIIYIYKILFS